MVNIIPFTEKSLPERKRRRTAGPNFAFTLMELLVVMGILGLLSSLVLVAVSKVKASSKTAQCKHNHRQCALTVSLFLGENHKYPSTLVFENLFRDGPSVYNACVSIKGPSFSYNGWGSGGRFVEETLGLTEAGLKFGDIQPALGIGESRVLSPNDMLMFLDYVEMARPPRMRMAPELIYTNFPHHGTINVSYCDGHVDSLTQRELMALPDTIKIKYNNDHLAHADTW